MCKNLDNMLFLLDKMYNLLIEAEAEIKLNTSKYGQNKEQTYYRSGCKTRQLIQSWML